MTRVLVRAAVEGRGSLSGCPTDSVGRVGVEVGASSGHVGRSPDSVPGVRVVGVSCVARFRRGCRGLVAFGCAAVVMSCSGGGARAGVTVNVAERDFKMTASASHVAGGVIEFRDHNAGPDTHEVLIVRTTLPAGRLPLRSDGITVNEEVLKPDIVGSIDFVPPGGTKTTKLRLEPGRYVLFCNMSGHYLGGMHVDLLVTAE